MIGLEDGMKKVVWSNEALAWIILSNSEVELD